MANSFLPSTDAGLLAWSANFSGLISATAEAFGLTTAEATAYAALHDAYADALAAVEPGVRSKATVAAKNTARTNLKTRARLLANIVQGQVNVTDAQKIELGLTVRSAPTPIPPPADSPALDVVAVIGRTVKIRLHDASNPSKRGKPSNVKGAAIFSFIGEEPPTNPASWKFEANTTRTDHTVTFASTVAPGTQVWLTAMWFNERAQSGPGCEPISTTLQFGSAMAA